MVRNTHDTPIYTSRQAYHVYATIFSPISGTCVAFIDGRQHACKPSSVSRSNEPLKRSVSPVTNEPWRQRRLRSFQLRSFLFMG